MSEKLQPVTPLGGAVAEDGLACRIEEIGPLGMITLRGDFSSAALQKAAAAIGGAGLPATRKITRNGDRGLAWMSPDELMIFCPRAEVASALASLAETMKGEHYQAVDVSDARAVLRLTGPAAREVLAKGAPVDLSRAVFVEGDFRRTRLGQVAVGFGQVKNDPEVFELICFRSVAPFVFEWLKTAARAGSMPEYL
jgi:sarcosine oxidase subunit gamma